MSDFLDTIKANSNQLNADDLIGGPITIKITAVKINNNADQPVKISFENDNNKPWVPSKTMRRILASKWGGDSELFIGRSVTLWRDSTVKWAGKAVGGVSISHMSDIDNEDRLMLTSNRGQKQSYKILRLDVVKEKTTEEKEAEKTSRANVFASQAVTELSEITTIELFYEWQEKNAATMKNLSKYKDAVKLVNDKVKEVSQSLTKEEE